MLDKGEIGDIERLCREILAPIIRADGGLFYLVGITAEDVHIHLAGACAGCPGSQLTRDRIIEPILTSTSPKAKVRVTTGWRVPDGAKKIE